MAWRGWSKTPLRKPLPALIVLFTCVIVSVCIGQRRDVPSNITYILLGLNGVSIGGYYTSSTIESRGNRCQGDNGGAQDDFERQNYG
jgi:uncharacterized membrane protein YuzA (DUF378 family)